MPPILLVVGTILHLCLKSGTFRKDLETYDNMADRMQLEGVCRRDPLIKQMLTWDQGALLKKEFGYQAIWFWLLQVELLILMVGLCVEWYAKEYFDEHCKIGRRKIFLISYVNCFSRNIF